MGERTEANLRGIGARLEFVAIFMLYSLVVCLKRKSNFKWIKIVISL